MPPPRERLRFARARPASNASRMTTGAEPPAGVSPHGHSATACGSRPPKIPRCQRGARDQAAHGARVRHRRASDHLAVPRLARRAPRARRHRARLRLRLRSPRDRGARTRRAPSLGDRQRSAGDHRDTRQRTLERLQRATCSSELPASCRRSRSTSCSRTFSRHRSCRSPERLHAASRRAARSCSAGCSIATSPR